MTSSPPAIREFRLLTLKLSPNAVFGTYTCLSAGEFRRALLDKSPLRLARVFGLGPVNRDGLLVAISITHRQLFGHVEGALHRADGDRALGGDRTRDIHRRVQQFFARQTG